MPPRRYENQPSGPEPRYRPGFGEEENIEEPKDKTPQQKPRPEEKKPEKKPEQDKKEVPKEDEKTKKPELSPEEKQERRSDAVERSLQLKKQFEESPIPNDPSTVARLIIAEHILSIDEQLQDPEALVGSGRKKETLEASLDFMCDLSEKFEDPTVESPPHIQDAYEALLELTEEALEVVDTPHRLVEKIAEALDLNLGSDETAAPAPEPTLPSDSTHPPQRQPLRTLPAIRASPAAKNLLIYLHLASLQPSTAAQPNFQPKSSYSDGGSVTNPDMPNVEHKSPLLATIESRTQDTIFTRPKVHDASEYHLAAQPNIAKPLAAVALASIAASAIHRTPDISHRHESTAAPATSNHTLVQPARREKISHSAAPPSHLEKPVPYAPWASAQDTPKNETFTPTSREFQPHTPETISSGRKLEHMSLPSLLALAHDVHLGHGRYLKDEFEHGRIDKDGLVKVLKAKKKGLNFAHEFNTQTANFRQRLQSIEFITKPPKPIYPNENTDQIPTTAASADSQPEKPKDAQKEVFAHPILKHYAHPEKSYFQASGKNPIPINLIVAILVIIILGTLIFFLLLPV